jgi:phosphoribosyl-ATP pyrophosphohydrolase/phosphoribosyl-AMP cyclohydrolase/histidinol dehydrogenase
MQALLKTVSPLEARASKRNPLDRNTIRIAAEIVEDVRTRGWSALVEHSVRLGDLADSSQKIIYSPVDLVDALEQIPSDQQALLKETCARIRKFASFQRRSVSSFEMNLDGCVVGQQIAPVVCAGCYAPGGRFPLPSSVLMTAATAREAGVKEVWVASPKPSLVTLAAAAVAGADGLIAAGGAQVIAALAYGAGEIPACDVIVGPGNRFVTAAKQAVFGTVRIDMLAGPSELAVVADDTADPETVAADLLAQAEHDPDAMPILVSLSKKLIDKVNEALVFQLSDLPTRSTAEEALKNGFAVFAPTLDAAIEVTDSLAPEHLELHLHDAKNVAKKCRHFGALFIGHESAEVLGDYGAGPNHTLPTSGSARHSGGLSVFDFLRIRTTLVVDDLDAAASVTENAVALARLEGLEGHARSAERRLVKK